MEKVCDFIAIQEAKLDILMIKLEGTLKNIIQLFYKFFDVPHSTQEISQKLRNLEEELKTREKILTKGAWSFQVHYQKVKHFMGLQLDLRREEDEIRDEILVLQELLIPLVEVMKNNVNKDRELITQQEFLVIDHMLELSSQLHAQ